MSRFIAEADRSQGTLLPESIDEYVAEENPVRVIEAFVEALDLAELGFAGVEPEGDGPPGLSPGDDAQDLPVRVPEPHPVDAAARAGSPPQPRTDVAGRAPGARLQDPRRLPCREHGGDQERVPRVHRAVPALATVHRGDGGDRRQQVQGGEPPRPQLHERQDEDADGADRGKHRRVPDAPRSHGSQGDAAQPAQGGTAAGSDRDAEGRDGAAERTEAADGSCARRPGVADRPRCSLDGQPGQGHRHRRLQRADGR